VKPDVDYCSVLSFDALTLVIYDVRRSRICALVAQGTVVQRSLVSGEMTFPPRVDHEYQLSDIVAWTLMLTSYTYQYVRLAQFPPLGRYGQLICDYTNDVCYINFCVRNVLIFYSSM